MTDDIKIRFPNSPGLTLEQAKESYEKIKAFKNELDKDNVAVYSNWSNITKSYWPRKGK